MEQRDGRIDVSGTLRLREQYAECACHCCHGLGIWRYGINSWGDATLIRLQLSPPRRQLGIAALEFLDFGLTPLRFTHESFPPTTSTMLTRGYRPGKEHKRKSVRGPVQRSAGAGSSGSGSF